MKCLIVKGPDVFKGLKYYLFNYILKYVSLPVLIMLCLCSHVFAVSVTLEWDHNTESDLAGYKIYYKTSSSGEPYNGTGVEQGTSPIAVPVEDLSDPNNPQYILSGLESNKAYFVVVTAYDTEGLESGFSNEVNVITIGLLQGSNLVSLCRQPDDTAISSVLISIEGKYSSVWAFIDDTWKVYDPADPGSSDLSTMEAGKGYWIDMKEAAILCVSNSMPSNQIDLLIGSNLVGYNSSVTKAIGNALASIDGNYESVWAFIDGSWTVYDPNNPNFSELTEMSSGHAYWIKTSKGCTWTIP